MSYNVYLVTEFHYGPIFGKLAKVVVKPLPKFPRITVIININLILHVSALETIKSRINTHKSYQAILIGQINVVLLKKGCGSELPSLQYSIGTGEHSF